jgi:hypothetical protein
MFELFSNFLYKKHELFCDHLHLLEELQIISENEPAFDNLYFVINAKSFKKLLSHLLNVFALHKNQKSLYN